MFTGRRSSSTRYATRTRSAIETVYQDLALAPHLTVAQNVFLGHELVVSGLAGRFGLLAKRQMAREASEALGLLGIAVGDARVRVSDLSGGQRQAVAIARAMKWARSVLLLDEPTAALGSTANRDRARHDPARLCARAGRARRVARHAEHARARPPDHRAPSRSCRREFRRGAGRHSDGGRRDARRTGKGAGRMATSYVGRDIARGRATTGSGTRRGFSGSSRQPALWIAVVDIGLILLFGLISPNHVFFNTSNFTNMALDSAEVVLLAVGISFLLGAGELDISIGANIILASVVGAQDDGRALRDPRSGRDRRLPPPREGARRSESRSTVLCGIGFGLVNAFIVTVLRVNSFIATLGTLGIGTGMAFVLANGNNIQNIPTAVPVGVRGTDSDEHPAAALVTAIAVAGPVGSSRPQPLRPAHPRDRLLAPGRPARRDPDHVPSRPAVRARGDAGGHLRRL